MSNPAWLAQLLSSPSPHQPQPLCTPCCITPASHTGQQLARCNLHPALLLPEVCNTLLFQVLHYPKLSHPAALRPGQTLPSSRAPAIIRGAHIHARGILCRADNSSNSKSSTQSFNECTCQGYRTRVSSRRSTKGFNQVHPLTGTWYSQQATCTCPGTYCTHMYPYERSLYSHYVQSDSAHCTPLCAHQNPPLGQECKANPCSSSHGSQHYSIRYVQIT
jgi:hypothetical protein